MTSVRVGTVTAEVLISDSTPSARVGTVTSEVLIADSTPSAKVGAVTSEVLIKDSAPSARIGGVYSEVVLNPVTTAQIGGVYSEVILKPNVNIGDLYTEVILTDSPVATQIGSVYSEVILKPNVNIGDLYTEVILKPNVNIGDLYTEVVLADSSVVTQIGGVYTEAVLLEVDTQAEIGGVYTDVLLANDTPSIEVGGIYTEVALFEIADVQIGGLYTEGLLLQIGDVEVGDLYTEVLITDDTPSVRVGGDYTDILITDDTPSVRVGGVHSEVLLTDPRLNVRVGGVYLEALIEPFDEAPNTVNVGSVYTETVLLQSTTVEVGTTGVEILLANEPPIAVEIGSVYVETLIQGVVTIPTIPNRVTWDEQPALYHEGVSQGVLYPQNSPGVAWNGLISVTENGDNAPDQTYVDGQKYRDHILPTAFSGTISAFTYPDEFEPYDGFVSGLTAQTRQTFGFCYRDNQELHIVYNALANPSQEAFSTVADNTAPVIFSWDFTTLPVDVPTARATSHLVISITNSDPSALSDLEDILYGSDSNDPYLPDPATIINLFESYTSLTITDNGDGTWTADDHGNGIITMLTSTTFQIDWPSAIFISADTYEIYSL